LVWVYGYSAVLLPTIFLLIALEAFEVIGRETRDVVMYSLIAVVPVTFLLALLRGAFARTSALHELGAWLAAGHDVRMTTEAQLAGVLGDPSLRLGDWVPGPGRYVDTSGVPFDAGALPGRRAAEVRVAGRLVGAIDYDTEQVSDEDTVQAAANVVAMAMDHERLTADLQASREALLASRERIVEATDAERRRIAQDLHDQMQSRFVMLSAAAANLAEHQAVSAQALVLHADIDAAATRLRAIIYEVMPAGLVERGLSAATADLADRMPFRVTLNIGSEVTDEAIPSAVANTAYLAIAEFLTNIAKHAKARAATVTLARRDGLLVVTVADDGVGGATAGVGMGTRGISDRIDALGGQFHIDSPAGGGTRIEVVLPCE
jgi:signal transduction histidine kinase